MTEISMSVQHPGVCFA